MKLSSPYLNVLIIVGAIMFYIDVILFGVDERIASMGTVNAFCMVCTADTRCCHKEHRDCPLHVEIYSAILALFPGSHAPERKH